MNLIYNRGDQGPWFYHNFIFIASLSFELKGGWTNISLWLTTGNRPNVLTVVGSHSVPSNDATENVQHVQSDCR